jgi:hypothetical protein
MNEMLIGLLWVILVILLVFSDVGLEPWLRLYLSEEYVSHLFGGQLGSHIFKYVVPPREKVVQVVVVNISISPGGQTHRPLPIDQNT